jgi:hypothetical protein
MLAVRSRGMTRGTCRACGWIWSRYSTATPAGGPAKPGGWIPVRSRGVCRSSRRAARRAVAQARPGPGSRLRRPSPPQESSRGRGPGHPGTEFRWPRQFSSRSAPAVTKVEDLSEGTGRPGHRPRYHRRASSGARPRRATAWSHDRGRRGAMALASCAAQGPEPGARAICLERHLWICFAATGVADARPQLPGPGDICSRGQATSSARGLYWAAAWRAAAMAGSWASIVVRSELQGT